VTPAALPDGPRRNEFSVSKKSAITEILQRRSISASEGKSPFVFPRAGIVSAVTRDGSLFLQLALSPDSAGKRSFPSLPTTVLSARRIDEPRAHPAMSPRGGIEREEDGIRAKMGGRSARNIGRSQPDCSREAATDRFEELLSRQRLQYRELSVVTLRHDIRERHEKSVEKTISLQSGETIPASSIRGAQWANASSTATLQNGQNAVDVAALTDTVYRMLESKIKIERERRGILR
jgi:hypothetical protein